MVSHWHESLSILVCLHHIAAMAGLRLSKQATNVIRATALLEEMEENAISETIRSAFDSQIRRCQH